MEDQGEKIVFLARALLETGAGEKAVTPKTAQITMTFKAFCFTTLLAAAGGGLAATCLHESQRQLNRYERYEVEALVFYTAKLKGTNEDTLRRIVEQKIGIAHFDDMQACDFQAVRKLLQEMAQ